jgi:rhodanese-related sulfurtransferase
MTLALNLFYFTLNMLTLLNGPSQQALQTQYQCLPCGQSCDNQKYNAPGKCEHCNMELVKTSSVSFKQIEPSGICAYIKSHPNAVLLDVRTKEEFEGIADPDFGTLKNAINVPIQELEKDLSKIKHLKNREILVFCSHSHRSPRASYLLTQNGFKNVTNMDGGMSVVDRSSACVKNR